MVSPNKWIGTVKSVVFNYRDSGAVPAREWNWKGENSTSDPVGALFWSKFQVWNGVNGFSFASHEVSTKVESRDWSSPLRTQFSKCSPFITGKKNWEVLFFFFFQIAPANAIFGWSHRRDYACADARDSHATQNDMFWLQGPVSVLSVVGAFESLNWVVCRAFWSRGCFVFCYK